MANVATSNSFQVLGEVDGENAAVVKKQQQQQSSLHSNVSAGSASGSKRVVAADTKQQSTTRRVVGGKDGKKPNPKNSNPLGISPEAEQLAPDTLSDFGGKSKPRVIRHDRHTGQRALQSQTEKSDRKNRGPPGTERRERRSGRGPFNWGDSIVIDQDVKTDETGLEDKGDKDENPADVCVSLGDYKKKLEAEKFTVSTKARKAGEGVDKGLGGYTAQKKEDDDLFSGFVTEEKKSTSLTVAKKDVQQDSTAPVIQKPAVDVAFRYGSDSNSHSHHGGRGNVRHHHSSGGGQHKSSSSSKQSSSKQSSSKQSPSKQSSSTSKPPSSQQNRQSFINKPTDFPSLR